MQAFPLIIIGLLWLLIAIGRRAKILSPVGSIRPRRQDDGTCTLYKPIPPGSPRIVYIWATALDVLFWVGGLVMIVTGVVVAIVMIVG
jgi:hypothetical protein